MFNMIILGASGLLMTTSIATGFTSSGKLGSTDEVSTVKTLLLTANVLAIITVLLLGAGIFLVHRNRKMSAPDFSGFTGLSVLVLSAIFMLVAGVLYIVAASKINALNKDQYSTSSKTAMASGIMSLAGLGAIGIALMTRFFGGRSVQPVQAPPVTTQATLVAPHNNPAAAFQQARQLQVAPRGGGDPRLGTL